MKRIVLGLIMTGLMLTAALPLIAQDEVLVIDVEKAVEMASANNLGLQSSYIDARGAEREWRNRWNAFLPTMGASASMAYSDQLFTDVNIPSYSSPPTEPWTLILNAQASLNLNLSTMTDIQQTQVNYMAGKLTFEEASLELETNVKKNFYSLLTTQASLDVLQRELDITEKRYQQAQANYRNGLIPEVDLLKVQVAVETLKPAYYKAEAGYGYALMMFKFILGLDPETEIEVEGNLDVEFVDLDAAQLMEDYLAGRLDLQILSYQIRSLELSKQSAAYGMMTPTFSVSATYGTRVNDPSDSDNWEDGTLQDNLGITFTLSMPLDSLIPGSAGNTTLKGLQDEIDKLELAQEQLYDSAIIEIINLVNTLQNSQRFIQAYRLSLDVARKNYELTEEAYRLGTKELLDVETAQKDMFEAEHEVLKEQMNYIASLLDLQYALSLTDEEWSGE